MTDMDRARVPYLAAYLDRLPNGLDSYPECLSKGSLSRTVLEDLTLPALPEGTLPDALAAHVAHPPAVSDWIPTVHHLALMVLTRDSCFEDDDRFLAYAFDSQYRLLSGRLYRLLLRVASAEMLLKGIGYRWAAFHKGTELKAEIRRPEGTMRLSFPPGLYDRLGARGLAEGFRAALVASGDAGVEVALSGLTETEAVYTYRFP